MLKMYSRYDIMPQVVPLQVIYIYRYCWGIARFGGTGVHGGIIRLPIILQSCGPVLYTSW
jgi:hypothetical protein